MPTDIILYAAIAVILIVWLLRTIGTKHGNERQRPNPFAVQNQVPDTKISPRPPVAEQGNRSLEATLVQIAIADPAFDARRFVEQAKDAFLFVVEAFAKGDRETLRDLLAPSVYTHFETEITARERAGETLQTEVRAFTGTEIIEASLDSAGQATVMVRFKVEELYALLASDGTVRAGDRIRPVTLTDIWSFTRNTRDRDPRWFVSATRPDTSADAARAG